MPSTVTQVRQAATADTPRMLRLLDQAVRQYTSFGKEDLPYLLTQGRVWLADAADSLWGFVCVTPRSSPMADLRALTLVNGWRVDAGVQTLLRPVIRDLQRESVTDLVCLGSAPWVVPPLQRAGFDLVDRIVYFERSSESAIPSSGSGMALRPVHANDLPTLLALDDVAFDPIWRFDRGHFMEMLVTTGHSVLAERQGEPVGYAITDVLGDTGFVVRLAVHPESQGLGIGSQILADALEYCHASGAGLVRLNTQESNISSHLLYQRFGFQRAGRRVPVLVHKS